MKFICPLIVVESIKKSKYLYKDLLGQKVKADFGENVTFEGDFAIHLKSHFSELLNNRVITSGSNSFELYFEHNKLEEIEKTLILNNFEFIHKIVEQPWKQRVLRFYDYDKHIIEVGESLEFTAYRLFSLGYPIEEISKLTYLSVDIIEKSIKEFKKNK